MTNLQKVFVERVERRRSHEETATEIANWLLIAATTYVTLHIGWWLIR